MRKTFYGILSFFLLLSCTSYTGQESKPEIDETTDAYFVSQADAKLIADAYLGTGASELIGTDTDETLRANANSTIPAYYIFAGEGAGFVIVSASETAYPVLAYSLDNKIDLNNLPDGLKYLLSTYSSEINQARGLGAEPSERMKRLREHLALRADKPAGDVIVAPLLGEIEWDQMPYYNALAPNPNVPIGCVATATSQIMRYWEYPEKAVGNYSYNSRNFGIISFDFNHTFDWAKMPKATLKKANEEIAILCYGVAVAVNMNFDFAYNGGSGAIHGDVPPALVRFYGYPKNILNVRRSDFEDEIWTAMIKNELDNQRPVQYGGAGSGGGHSFVLDGYDSTDLFHVNWGWAGQSNGWFKINALDPDDLGTGGGSGGFNRNQDMIINFAPPARVEGDNNGMVPDDEDTGEDVILDNGIAYEDVIVFNKLDFYIRYTKFGSMEITSGSDGYKTYFTSSIDVAAGDAMDFTVEYLQNNHEGTFPKVAIFIDLNNDGKFDKSTEMIYDTPLGEYSVSQSGSYTIPSVTEKGLHRMRVIAYDLSLKDPNAKALLKGEVEDYYVNVK